MKNYFLFRGHQLLRLISYYSDITLIGVLLLGLIWYWDLPSPWVLFILFFGMLASYHFNRSDLGFLKHLFPKSIIRILILEYSFMFLVFETLFLFKSFDPTVFIGNLLLVFLLPYVNLPVNSTSLKLDLNILGNDLFEWKGFMRKNSVFIFYYAALLVSSFHIVAYSLVLLFVIEHYFEIYKFHEPQSIYISYFQKHSIETKIKNASLFLHILFAPSYLLLLVFNFSYWAHLLLIIGYIQLALTFVIYWKYSNYNPLTPKKTIVPLAILIYILYCFCILPALIYIRIMHKKHLKLKMHYVGI